MKNKILLSGIALITFFSSTAQQWEYLGDPGFTTTAANSSGLAVSSDGTLYMLASIQNSSTEVWTYNDSTWELVGPSNFSGYTSTNQSICISDNDSIYVAMSEWPVGEKASVMKFNGTDWIYVGGAGFSDAKATDTDIITINDSIYTSFVDYGVDQKLSVMKFNGTGWSYVGTQGFTDSTIYPTTTPILQVYNGAPYIGFSDNAVGGKMSVMRYDGFNWEYVGLQGFTTNAVRYADFNIDANGVPYVSFSDGSVGDKASVMKFDGTNWVYAGTAGLTSIDVGFTKLGFDEFDRPHIAYMKDGGSHEMVIQMFDFANWNSVGGTVSAPDGGTKIDFKVVSYGKYYVSFSDYSVSGLKHSVMAYDLSSNIEELDNSNTFGVFPNPANDIITIDNNGEAFESVTILSLSGQIILSTRLANTIDISELPNGVYLIELLTNEGKKISRFVKG